jgi:hypothetical protein
MMREQARSPRVIKGVDNLMITRDRACSLAIPKTSPHRTRHSGLNLDYAGALASSR